MSLISERSHMGLQLAQCLDTVGGLIPSPGILEAEGGTHLLTEAGAVAGPFSYNRCKGFLRGRCPQGLENLGLSRHVRVPCYLPELHFSEIRSFSTIFD